MTIFDELKKNAGRRLPMHMPGHKRRATAEYLEKLACDIDVSEIEGFDDLNAPEGIIADAERRAAGFDGPMFLLYSVYDGAEDKQAVTALLDEYLDSAKQNLMGGNL